MYINIRYLKEKDLGVIRKLLSQLTPNVTNLQLEDLPAAKDCLTRVIVEECNTDEPLAFCALSIRLVPSKGRVGTIEDLIVDREYRGYGLGKELLKDILLLAKIENLRFVELTSNPKRKVARHLYQKFGFRVLETDIFRLQL